MKHFLLKLRNKKGETIVETLVGVLIVAMGTTILVTGITAALKVNKETKEMSTKIVFTIPDPLPASTTQTLVIRDASNVQWASINVNEYIDTTNGNNYIWFD